MGERMTNRERILRTFQKKRVDKVVWQPRIYYWYYGNRLKNKLPNGYRDKSLLNFFYNNIQSYNGNVPQRYRDKSMTQIYDDLNASPRYPQEILGVNLFKIKNRKVRTKSLINGKEKIVIYKTPIGNLKEVIRGGHHTEFLVKNLSDVKIIKYILDRPGP